MNLYILFQDEFAERVAGQLINDINYCTSCDAGCNHCRIPYGCFAGSIAGYEEITGDMPEFIDDPEVYFPSFVPDVDLLIPVGLHPDIASGVPTFAKEHGIPAVLFPVEDKNWIPFGLQRQLMHEFDDLGIQHAFPRPFCDLDVAKDSVSKSIIREFMYTFKVGKPIISLHVKNGKIMNGSVIRSQPCGCAYYIIQQLRGERVYDEVVTLDEKISLAHHSFPCSASMETDPFLRDSPLHIGGYLARDAVHDALELELGIVDKKRLHKEIQYVEVSD
ncbi:MAG: DUF166 domain-containing protein [Candidatus Hodarchaeota archaeon]